MPLVTVRKRQARRLTPALTREVARRLKHLGAEQPGSKKAGVVRAELEHGLMQLLAGGGLRACDALIRALNGRGRNFAPLERSPHSRVWREAGPDRELDVQLTRNRLFRTVLVSYRAVPNPDLARSKTRLDELRDAFYARYLAAGKIAYAEPPGRLRPTDRTILLIGELEADVNNGGFAQYLSNKGRRRARSALAALDSVGARRAAKMLTRALEPDASETTLARLDDRFYSLPEDLAVLAMRHVETKSKRR